MTTETPPRTTSRADAGMGKVAVGLLVILAFVALVAYMVGGKSDAVNPLGAAAPLRVSVPSIQASSSLIPLGQQPDGSLAVPPLSQAMQASWYDKSPTPGELGPSIVLGHINGNGKQGIFSRLAAVKSGDQINVDRADGQTAVFTVSHVDLVPKDRFPSQAVYGNTPDSEIRLITCGGELDRKAHSYLSNTVVYGNLTGVHKT